MTYAFTDPEGDRIVVNHFVSPDGTAFLEIAVDSASDVVHVPLDRVEELVAGIRDAARHAARSTT